MIKESWIEKVLSIKNSHILLDVDGTIVSDGDINIDKNLKKAIIHLKKDRNKIYLCSNAKDKKRIREIAKKLTIRHISIKYKKPSRKILSELNIPVRSNIIVIGDKFLTDGIFAKRIGARYIKSVRLRSKKEKISNKLTYHVDDLCFYLYQKIRIK